MSTSKQDEGEEEEEVRNVENPTSPNEESYCDFLNDVLSVFD